MSSNSDSQRRAALVVCITAPWPVNSGTRLRSYSAIQWLLKEGYRVTIVYFGRPAHSDAEITNELGVHSVHCIQPEGLLFWRIRSFATKLLGKNPTSGHEEYKRLQPGFAGRIRFRRLLKKLSGFELSVTEYSIASSLSKPIESNLRLLDMCDIMSIHYQKVHAAALAKKCFDEGKDKCFTELSFWHDGEYQIEKMELEDCGGYDGLIAISASEHTELRRLLPDIPCKLIPPTVEVEESGANDYQGLPVFVFSPNIFNIQGLTHLIHRIIPLVLETIPEFKMLLTGPPTEVTAGCPQIIATGFVPDLTQVYHSAAFAIIPSFGGTGQQLKVVEAMAHGLAVVGYEQRIDNEILSNGIEGFLAGSERDFADAIVKLWRDRDLCRQMGDSARIRCQERLSQNSFNLAASEFVRCLKNPVRGDFQRLA